MAKNKKGKGGGKAKGSPRRLHTNSAATHHATLLDENPARSTFSLRDAARNSAHPRAFWTSSSQQLRNQSMTFVRSVEAPMDRIDLDTVPSQKVSRQQDEHGTKSSEIRAVSVDEQLLRQRSPSPASSSGDEIIFEGRGQAENLSANTLGLDLCEENSPELKDPPQNAIRRLDDFASSKGFLPLSGGKSRSRKQSLNRNCHRVGQQTHCGKGLKTLPTTSLHRSEVALEDYLSNLRDYGEVAQCRGAQKARDMGEWLDFEDFEDSNDLDTCDNVQDVITRVLSKRHRSGGVQYLVVWEDQSIDEARWIHQASMPASAALLVSEFENALDSTVRRHDASDTGSEADWDTEDDLDAVATSSEGLDDEMEDESDLVQRRIDRMSDEHLARLLQKQESLGIHSEELQLFDGVEDIDLSDAMIVPRRAKVYRKKSQKGAEIAVRTRSSSVEESDDMSENLDDYVDFDIMDRDRLSIFASTKAYKSQLPFALSDSDLADGLRNAWETDRKKKKAKKQEREELRAQGRLGSKNKMKPDLKARYNDGLSLDHLQREIEDFLYNDRQDSLALPPMDKRDRKIMHDIANAFGLNSKSQGSGKKRFTILFKTSRTLDFDHDDFARLRTQISRRFFTRMDKRGAKGGRGGLTVRRGKNPGSGADAGYREGDVVGAAAPEIGSENRGRAMLEKMGWSMGTALGALDNQGILKPIQHVVRNSKAGLG